MLWAGKDFAKGRAPRTPLRSAGEGKIALQLQLAGCRELLRAKVPHLRGQRAEGRGRRSAEHSCPPEQECPETAHPYPSLWRVIVTRAPGTCIAACDNAKMQMTAKTGWGRAQICARTSAREYLYTEHGWSCGVKADSCERRPSARNRCRCSHSAISASSAAEGCAEIVGLGSRRKSELWIGATRLQDVSGAATTCEAARGQRATEARARD